VLPPTPVVPPVLVPPPMLPEVPVPIVPPVPVPVPIVPPVPVPVPIVPVPIVPPLIEPLVEEPGVEVLPIDEALPREWPRLRDERLDDPVAVELLPVVCPIDDEPPMAEPPMAEPVVPLEPVVCAIAIAGKVIAMAAAVMKIVRIVFLPISAT
jgi:hypothetical protein